MCEAFVSVDFQRGREDSSPVIKKREYCLLEYLCGDASCSKRLVCMALFIIMGRDNIYEPLYFYM